MYIYKGFYINNELQFYAGMPERSNGTDSKSVSLVLTKVRILLPALNLIYHIFGYPSFAKINKYEKARVAQSG